MLAPAGIVSWANRFSCYISHRICPSEFPCCFLWCEASGFSCLVIQQAFFSGDGTRLNQALALLSLPWSICHCRLFTSVLVVFYEFYQYNEPSNLIASPFLHFLGSCISLSSMSSTSVIG